VLQVADVLLVSGVCYQPQGLTSRAMQCCYEMEMCYSMLSW
jgi:hypothetical protein